MPPRRTKPQAETARPVKEVVEGKLPPQDLEAEQSVLGALMIDKNAIIKVADTLSSDDFYSSSHKKIYEAIIELFNKNQPIDILTVSSRLKEKDSLEEAGGLSYLSLLVNSVPTSSHIAHYAGIISKKRILRDLIQASYEISEIAYQEKHDINDILEKAEKKIFSIFQHVIGQLFSRIKDELKLAFQRMDHLSKNKGELRGTPTDFAQLDGILEGLQKSDLIIIAARPSLGKSSLALDIARHVSVRRKIPVGIYSLEMSKDQVVDRLVAAQAAVDLVKIRTGNLSDSDFSAINRAMGEIAESDIYINDAASPTIAEIKATARRLMIETHNKLGLLVVDYLQLIQPENSSANLVQEITQISRGLKVMAKDLNIPVIAISQLSRAVELRPNQIPRLADLRESGAIEQDADVVIFIHRKMQDEERGLRENETSLIVAKHRNGPTGGARVEFVPAIVSFRDPISEDAYGNEMNTGEIEVL